jgi:hypothetical protein
MNPSFTFEAGRLRLNLTWHADRFAHSIGVTSQGRLMPLLASVEGTADVEWPPSPPVQSVEPDPKRENGQIMCVGMAGRCHWSAGIQLDARSQSAVFDVACRVKQAPPTGTGNALGSLYRTMTAVVIESARTLCVEVDGAGLRIESLPPSYDTPAAALHVTASGIRISPSGSIDQTPSTIRWRYSVTVQ